MRIFISMTALIVLIGCGSTPKQAQDAKDFMRYKTEMQKTNEVLEASDKSEPDWVASYVDNFDSQNEFNTVGRAEINANGSSQFRCFDISKVTAKANMISFIKTDLSEKVISGFEGTDISKQEIKKIITTGFEVRNISGIKITKNYYKKVMKYDDHAGPVATYQCWTLATVDKFKLQQLLIDEADKNLNKGTSEKFKDQLNDEWNRFFKITPSQASTKVKFEDLQVRDSLRHELVTNKPVEQVRENVARIAKAFVGIPYQFGGDIADGGKTDCSAFTRKVYQVVGFNLPRTSPEQFNDRRLDDVSGEYQAGDLIFFRGFRGEGQVSHVGIMLNGNEFVNANGNAGKVQVDSLDSEYWKQRVIGAKRAITSNTIASLAANE